MFEFNGFKYFVMCIDPGFDGNAVRNGLVDATSELHNVLHHFIT